MDSDIDPKVREFIEQHVDSVEKLEILALLLETTPRAWTPAEVNARLHSSQSSIERRLHDLCEKGFISCSNGLYGFPGVLLEQQELVADVIKTYKLKRIRVIEMIFSRPTQKLRTFSDAFRIRKDLDNG